MATRDDKKKKKLEEAAAAAEAMAEATTCQDMGKDAQLVELEQEVQTLRDKWMRTAAEFENFRRRTESEKSRWIKNATERLVLEVCDVLDNFERAIETGVQEHQFESFLKGVELIHKQLADVLGREGVSRIEAQGEEFDPMVHDAISQIPADAPADTVVTVVQKGYIMHDKVIRPARVVVSRGPLQPDIHEIEIEKEE